MLCGWSLAEFPRYIERWHCVGLWMTPALDCESFVTIRMGVEHHTVIAEPARC